MNIATTLKRMGYRQGDKTFQGVWKDKSWLNTPGTLYCGQTDNCYTGPLEAPNNVFTSPDGYEILFRQPVSQYELDQVISAAECDPFSGYCMDGDRHWTRQLICEWWRDAKPTIIDSVTARLKQQEAEPSRDWHESGCLYRWRAYLQKHAEADLRNYMYFLDHGRYPFWFSRLPELRA